MPFRAMHIAFTGPRPDVKPGDRVWCRTADGEWLWTCWRWTVASEAGSMPDVDLLAERGAR